MTCCTRLACVHHAVIHAVQLFTFLNPQHRLLVLRLELIGGLAVHQGLTIAAAVSYAHAVSGVIHFHGQHTRAGRLLRLLPVLFEALLLRGQAQIERIRALRSVRRWSLQLLIQILHLVVGGPRLLLAILVVWRHVQVVVLDIVLRPFPFGRRALKLVHQLAGIGPFLWRWLLGWPANELF